MTLILVILLVLLLFGGAWGYRSGYVGTTPVNPISILVIVLVVILIFALLGGPRLGWWDHW